jgi:MinD-like ATPase involved in chromosome partitioning or flagellar assembly
VSAVLLVISPEDTAARHARAFWTCAPTKIWPTTRIVVNRSGSASGLTAGRLDEMFGPRLIVHVDSDGPMVVNAISTNQPFVYALPEHRLSVQLGALAHTLADA